MNFQEGIDLFVGASLGRWFLFLRLKEGKSVEVLIIIWHRVVCQKFLVQSFPFLGSSTLLEMALHQER